MAFMNEKTNLVEHQKYSLLCRGAIGCYLNYTSEWTIDREREMLLVHTGTERQDMYEGDFMLEYWRFYWRGQWVSFTSHKYPTEFVSETLCKTFRKVFDIEIPSSLLSEQSELFSDLKTAFDVYGLMGAVITEYKTDAILDFSEVM